MYLYKALPNSIIQVPHARIEELENVVKQKDKNICNASFVNNLCDIFVCILLDFSLCKTILID